MIHSSRVAIFRQKTERNFDLLNRILSVSRNKKLGIPFQAVLQKIKKNSEFRFETIT